VAGEVTAPAPTKAEATTRDLNMGQVLERPRTYQLRINETHTATAESNRAVIMHGVKRKAATPKRRRSII